MGDLFNQIAEKAGVTVQQAKEGFTMSVAWVREKLPADVAELFDGAGDLATGAMGKARDAGASAVSKAGSVLGAGADTAASVWGKTKDSVSDVMPEGE